MRNESCGLSTSEMTQPSGPFTTMRLSVTARPLLSKGQQNQQCSDNLRHRGLALFAALLIVRLRTNYH